MIPRKPLNFIGVMILGVGACFAGDGWIIRQDDWPGQDWDEPVPDERSSP